MLYTAGITILASSIKMFVYRQSGLLVTSVGQDGTYRRYNASNNDYINDVAVL